MSPRLRSALGRGAYALILWLLAFSTLEQFAELNEYYEGLNPTVFHLLACAIALAAALFEAVTLRGLGGLRSFWDRPDPIGDIANRACNYRVALSEDLPDIRQLAVRRYGWAFPLPSLQRWHACNPNCFYLMKSEGELIGYVDAFPISDHDYQSLLAGGDEELITPLREDDVDPGCSFYIASVVIAENWGGRLQELLRRATNFYGRCYETKIWGRVCAVGYSPEGRRLLEKKQARRVTGGNREVRMYAVDRSMLHGLKRPNQALWRKLLPDPPAAP